MIYFPQISPIFFRQIVSGVNLSPDFGTQFEGINYLDWCHDWPINVPLVFQFFSDNEDPVVRVGDTDLVLTEITPSGWDGLGSFVYQTTYTPTVEGQFTIDVIEDGLASFYESQPINVVSDVANLVKIGYKNSENDYGYVGTSTLISYLEGEFSNVQPENEIVSYKNDRGVLTKLRATPIEAYELRIFAVPYFIVNMINLIFSCDTITVNGVAFQTEETTSIERIEERADLFNVSVIIKKTNSEYVNETTSTDGLTFIGDNSNNIISDSNNNLVTL